MIPDNAFDGLCYGARMAVESAWYAAHRTVPGIPDEIDHIYALVANGIPVLGFNWGQVLKPLGISLRVTGVFCHQTPKAHFTLPGHGLRSPELADILFVHEHRFVGDGEAHRQRRAVLIQAKMTHSGVPSAVDATQEFLYEHWPPFELKGRGPKGQGFLPGMRHIAPNEGGSRYGLIAKAAHLTPHFRRRPFSCDFPTWFANPVDTIRTAGGEDAGAFVANMLFRSTVFRGRDASIPSNLNLSTSPNNHFDVTVEELLAITAQKTLRFKRKKYVTGLRGVPALACFQVEERAGAALPETGRAFEPTGDGDGGEGVPEEGEFEYDDGISIVLIETGGGEPPTE